MLMIAGFDRFPEVFDCIVKVGSTNDCFYEDDVFPKDKYICSLFLHSYFIAILILIYLPAAVWYDLYNEFVLLFSIRRIGYGIFLRTKAFQNWQILFCEWK